MNVIRWFGHSLVDKIRKFLKITFPDHISSGLTGPTSGDLTHTITTGEALVEGYYASIVATGHTYTASRDTYVDLSRIGVLTFVEVANAAGEPAVTANSIRFLKVITNGSAITSSVRWGGKDGFLPALVSGSGKLPDANLQIATLALRDGSSIFGTQGGTGDDYTATFLPVFPAYNKGMTFIFTPNSNNAGIPSFKVDSLTALNILKWSRGALVDLEPNDLISGSPVFIMVNESVNRFILLTPSQITDAMLSANVALLDAAQTFSAQQRIAHNTNFALIIDRLDGADFGTIIARHAGVDRWRFATFSAEPKFRLQDTSGVERFSVDMSDGKVVTAKIPLLRLETDAGSLVFDSSDKMIAGTVPHGRTLAKFTGSGSTAILDVSVGTVAIGDIIMVSANCQFTTGASFSTPVDIDVGDGGGTAVITVEAGSRERLQVAGSLSYGVSLFASAVVTTAGTQTMRISLSGGTPTPISMALTAYVFKS